MPSRQEIRNHNADHDIKVALEEHQVLKHSLFIGVFPTGLGYADKRLEEHGDWVTVAFLPYSTLELEVRKPKSDLLPLIRADAEKMEAMRGQPFAIASNMTIILGGGK